ncbi:response regulator [Phenylobacterium sp.]|uniref:response regulator n=1 Tax=Phenylobacterium sp. TaxID=1871053 RepID=UPI0035B0BBE4
MVADDGEVTRKRLSRLIAELPTVDVLGTPAERGLLLGRFAEFRPHCVVIDVPAHNGDGFDLLQTLRNLDRSCVIIALTNHPPDEFRRHSVGVGADRFFVKWRDFERVVETIQMLGNAIC